jgi:hypothetical protein
MRPKPDIKDPKPMIIRNIPAAVRQSAKIAAAELGITLQDFHVRALKLALMQKGTILNMEDVR